MIQLINVLLYQFQISDNVSTDLKRTAAKLGENSHFINRNLFFRNSCKLPDVNWTQSVDWTACIYSQTTAAHKRNCERPSSGLCIASVTWSTRQEKPNDVLLARKKTCASIFFLISLQHPRHYKVTDYKHFIVSRAQINNKKQF